jgi:5-methylcytosine-specific restriction endonuclease McrA
VILHVDHIVAVAEGGGNEEENLIAACSDCNHGKHVKPLDQQEIPRDYKAMAEDAKVKAQQLDAYRKHLAELRRAVDESIDFVGAFFWGKPGTTWSRDGGAAMRAKTERFIELIGLDRTSEAARVAFDRLPDRGRDRSDQRFKYFCGVCWNTATRLGIRGDDDAR